MKKKYAVLLFCTMVVALILICISIFRPGGVEVNKPAQPTPQAQKQPVLQTEPAPEPSQMQQLEQASVTTENVKETVAVDSTAQKARQKQPSLAEQTDSQPQLQTAEAEADEYEQQVAVVTDSNIYSVDGNLLAVEIPQAPPTVQQQRHQERLEQVERDLRPTYSKEQLERMREQILTNLPKSYREMFENFDRMKQAEVERRRLARSRQRQISRESYYFDGDTTEQTSTPEPWSSTTKPYKDKDK